MMAAAARVRMQPRVLCATGSYSLAVEPHVHGHPIAAKRIVDPCRAVGMVETAGASIALGQTHQGLVVEILAHRSRSITRGRAASSASTSS